MKIKSVVATAAVLGGILPLSSFAAVIAPLHAPAATVFAAPAPAEVVSPTGLLRRHAGTVVRLGLTIDAAGRPHDIRILSGQDENLARNLLPAVARWRFTPALKDGTPVETRVVLPVELVDGPDS